MAKKNSILNSDVIRVSCFWLRQFTRFAQIPVNWFICIKSTNNNRNGKSEKKAAHEPVAYIVYVMHKSNNLMDIKKKTNPI
jgi:hypothetical protein